MRTYAVTLAMILASCGGTDSGARDTLPKGPAGTAPDTADMTRAALSLAAFLVGQSSIDTSLMADSITLYVAPEGGGHSATLPRNALRERSGWAVRDGGRSIAFTPDIGLTKLTTQVGRHFRCFPADLAAKVPQLGALPHVGIKMEPVPASSCLNTWNLTVVFDSTSRRPRIIAALYDQWEW